MNHAPNPMEAHPDAAVAADELPCGYIVTSPDGQIRAANRAFLELIGYERDQVEGKLKLHDLLTPGGKIFYETHYALLLKMTGQVRAITLDLVHKSRSSVPVLIHATQVQDQAQTPLFNRVVIFDCRDRRAYEAELLAARKQAEADSERIAAQERFLREVLLALPGFIAVLDLSGNFIESNGIGSEGNRTKRIQDYPAWSNTEDQRRQLQNAIERGALGLPSRFDLVAGSGEETVRDFSLVPLWGETAPTHLIVSAADITARHRAERALRESHESLLTTNESLGQFAYAVSHDLQEPLRGIVVYSELLQRQIRSENADNECSAKLLDGVLDSAKRMQTLITDLLEFCRAGGVVVTREIDLNECVEIAVTNLRNSIEASRAQIEIDTLPSVQVDPGRITQVIQNLISNSIKYRRAGIDLRISLSARPLGEGQCVVEVRDNGMGFDPVDAEKIFGIFKRLHGREIPGTGVGLALCQKIVEAHGGRIWAAGRPQEGASFFFTLLTARPFLNSSTSAEQPG